MPFDQYGQWYELDDKTKNSFMEKSKKAVQGNKIDYNLVNQRINENIARQPIQPPEKNGFQKTMDKLLQASSGANKVILGTNPLDDLYARQQKYGEEPTRFSELGNPENLTTGDNIARGTGNAIGFLMPYSKAYQFSNKALQGTKLLNSMSKLGKGAKYGEDALKGGLSGLQVGLATEGRDAFIGADNQTLGDRAKDVALEAGLGAIGDPLVRGLGVLAKKSISPKLKTLFDRLKKGEINEQELSTVINNDEGLKREVLLLNEGQKQLNAPSNVMKPKYKSPTNQAKDEILALNPAQTRQFTPAKKGKDYYQQRFNELINTAKNENLSPGREFENLQDVWSRMANETDHSLDELIKLANPSQRNIKPLDALKKAKENQQNSVYGIDNLINRLKVNKEYIPPTNEGKPLQFTRERYNPIIEDKPLNFTGKIEPFNKTKIIVDKPKIDDNLLNSLQFGDRIKVRKDRGEIDLEFIKRVGNDVVVRRNNGKETVIPAELIKGKTNLDKFNSFVEKINPKSSSESVKLSPSKSIESIKTDNQLDNADNWKDKANLSLIRETMDRNFDDIMGKEAPKMKEIYLDPIKKAEAERNRFLNKERDDVRGLGVKYKSNEDKLIQQYGEGVITLDELKQKAPNSWEKISKATETFRNKYDYLLDQVNEVLTRNGYDAIPKRENYFPHYQELDDIFSKFGIKLEDHTLPTDLNGLTADLKPGKSFFSHALQRKGNQTTYGAIEGFDRYIEGISRLIHHTDNIQRLRGLENDIRTKYEGTKHLTNFVAELREYTNHLAGKKALIDRGVEKAVGRKVYGALDEMRRRFGANAVGMNVASAATNFIPLTQAMATTNKKAFVEGMFDTLLSTVKNDDFINQSDFLTRRVGSDPLAMNLWQKVGDKSSWIFKVVDNLTSQTIVRGKYKELISKGLSHEQAMKQADDWAAKIIADRSLGSTPTMFNSRTLGTLGQFQLEVNNQLSFLFKDIPRNFNKVAAASAIGQTFLYSYLFNEMYEKAIGRRPAFDPFGVVKQFMEDNDNPNLDDETVRKNLVDNVLNQLPFTSMLEGGRIPLGGAIPDVTGIAKGESDWKKELLKPATYLLSPTGGGQIKKTIEGLTALNKNPLKQNEIPGEYYKNGEDINLLKYPIKDNIPNSLRGVLFGKYSFPETQNYYDNNRRQLTEDETKQVETLYKKGQNYNKEYELIQLEKRLNKVEKDKKLSDEEKDNRIKKLNELIRKLRKEG